MECWIRPSKASVFFNRFCVENFCYHVIYFIGYRGILLDQTKCIIIFDRRQTYLYHWDFIEPRNLRHKFYICMWPYRIKILGLPLFLITWSWRIVWAHLDIKKIHFFQNQCLAIKFPNFTWRWILEFFENLKNFKRLYFKNFTHITHKTSKTTQNYIHVQTQL